MNKTFLKYFSTLVIIFFVSTTNTFSQKKTKAFIDSLDNAFDMSYYLYDLHGFLPVIAPITEPAIGYGAAAAGIFFIPKEKDKNKKFKLPDVVGLAGGLTENNTWFAGLGYIGFWNDDNIRYRGIFGYGALNLEYYGTGGTPIDNKSIKFSIDSYFFLQQAVFRIAGSKYFIGGRYQFSNSTVNLFNDRDYEYIDPKDIELINSGIGIITEFENFDNVFSPTKGLRVNLSYDQYLKTLGGGKDFGRLSTFMHYYKPFFSGRLISGLRIESQLANGDIPFYMLPFISLRGVPAMRYQGELTALVETEQQFMINNRWGIVGFAGYGKTFKSLDDMATGSDAWNAGTGFRYLIARMFGLKMGVDVARGPEQWAVYVVVGTSWLK